ncbi:MAG: hypothetical protein ABSA97_01310 [Verrucomicrobiia bacterium]
MHDKPSKAEMITCLQKSGYLLEGRLVKALDALGLLVEPSQSLLDETTGVSREVDIVAESYRQATETPKICVKTTFVIEAINNIYPVVLLTRKLWTPNTPSDDYLHYKVTPSEDKPYHPFLDKLDLQQVQGVHRWEIYSQYCAFTRKKQNDELMASHPEDLHASIRKAVSYLFVSKDEYYGWMDNHPEDSYWRLFQWQALVVLQGDLYIMREDERKKPDLVAVGVARLEYNFHHRGTPRTVIVNFVTESALPQFVEEVLVHNETIETQIAALRPSADTGENTTA